MVSCLNAPHPALTEVHRIREMTRWARGRNGGI